MFNSKHHAYDQTDLLPVPPVYSNLETHGFRLLHTGGLTNNAVQVVCSVWNVVK